MTPSLDFLGRLKDRCVWSRASSPDTMRGSWNLIQTFSQSLRDPPPLIGFASTSLQCCHPPRRRNRNNVWGTRGSFPRGACCGTRIIRIWQLSAVTRRCRITSDDVTETCRGMRNHLQHLMLHREQTLQLD